MVTGDGLRVKELIGLCLNIGDSICFYRSRHSRGEFWGWPWLHRSG
jgi:hypothetical protein